MYRLKDVILWVTGRTLFSKFIANLFQHAMRGMLHHLSDAIRHIQGGTAIDRTSFFRWNNRRHKHKSSKVDAFRLYSSPSLSVRVLIPSVQ